jgi:hypothetical protein
MRKKQNLGGLVTLALLTALIGIAVAGHLSKSRYSGQDLKRISTGQLSHDGWVGQEARISIEGFSNGLNSVVLTFSPTRPGARELARVALSVCGSPEREFEIGSASPVSLSLPSGCSPAVVSIRGLNFFTPPNEKTPREVSAQLLSVRVRSVLSLPIPELERALPTVLTVLSLVALGTAAASSFGLPVVTSGLMALLFVSCAVLFVRVPPDRWLPFSVFVCAVLAGVATYAKSTARRGEFLSTGGKLAWAAVILGAALRLYGLSFGLPSNFHPDEVPKVNAIMRMVDSRSFNPQYFLHPSLLLYATYGMNTLLHALGMEGAFRDTAFFAGRLVSALAGIFSIALTYQIGKRLFSRETGGLAACLLAVFPLHVTCSRYLKEDALLTFVVLSCVLTTVIAVRSNRRWALLIAGLLAGCTAGTKYSGILMVVVPASAPWLASRSWKPDTRWIPWALVAVMIAPLGFLMTTPYAVLNSAKFLTDFRAESRHMQTGHTVSISAWSQLWMYHYWRSMWPGMSGFAAVLSVLGLGFLVRRARIEDLLLVGVVLLFYMPAEYVKAKPAPQPERYILPCLPFLAIAASELLRQLHGRGKVFQVGVAALAGVLVFLPLQRTLALASNLRSDTRDQMVAWMKQSVPPGSKILMDWKPYCPNFHGETFEVLHIPRADIIEGLDVKALKESGADYLILSSLFYDRYFSQPDAVPAFRQRIRDVFNRLPVVARFEAPSGTYGFHNPALTLFSLKSEDGRQL